MQIDNEAAAGADGQTPTGVQTPSSAADTLPQVARQNAPRNRQRATATVAQRVPSVRRHSEYYLTPPSAVPRRRPKLNANTNTSPEPDAEDKTKALRRIDRGGSRRWAASAV